MPISDKENPSLDSIFNQDLVNCLPGIFYLYEVKAGKSYLKRWNNNHVKVTEYSPEEMLNKEALSFIDDISKEFVTEGINTAVNNGSVKNVYGNILTKTGKIIPYVFEAYLFYSENKMYFMGMGLDISDLVSAKEQIRLLEFQKKKKERELFSVALQKQNKEQLLQKILVKLESLESKVSSNSNAKAIQSLTNEIKSHFSFNDNWKMFKKMFCEIHFDFFNNLINKHPNLSKGELQYCAYLKIQMSNADICSVMSISKEGVAKKRYRLKKRLKLTKDEDLDMYIFSF